MTNTTSFKDLAAMKRAASDAISVQDASNLSGVVHSFARAMTTLCAEGMSTDERNLHPIAQLFAVQVAHLTGLGSADPSFNYRLAVMACEAIVSSNQKG